MPAFAGITRETWMADKPGHDAWLVFIIRNTLGFVARQNFANRADKLGLGHGELRLGLLL